ncbi:MAG: hypothetical protein KC646_12920 [Candidatus Cloacimonetes bacterium]|nr:hypothetical protein [Candidatus Cloacimonadota bacterium]
MNFFIILFSPILAILSDLFYVLIVLPPFIPLFISFNYDSITLQVICGLSAIPIGYVEYKFYKLIISPSLKELDESLQESNDPKLYQKVDQLSASVDESTPLQEDHPPLILLARTFRYGSYSLSQGQFALLTLSLILFIPIIGGIAIINIDPNIVYLFFVPCFGTYFWLEKKRVILKLKFEENNCHIYNLRTDQLLETVPANRIQAYFKKISYPGLKEVLILEKYGEEIGRLGPKDKLNHLGFETIKEKLDQRRLLK